VHASSLPHIILRQANVCPLLQPGIVNQKFRVTYFCFINGVSSRCLCTPRRKVRICHVHAYFSKLSHCARLRSVWRLGFSRYDVLLGDFTSLPSCTSICSFSEQGFHNIRNLQLYLGATHLGWLLISRLKDRYYSLRWCQFLSCLLTKRWVYSGMHRNIFLQISNRLSLKTLLRRPLILSRDAWIPSSVLRTKWQATGRWNITSSSSHLLFCVN